MARGIGSISSARLFAVVALGLCLVQASHAQEISSLGRELLQDALEEEAEVPLPGEGLDEEAIFPEPEPEPEIVEKQCTDEILYFIDVQFNWTAENHPNEFPVDAKWSPLVGAVHNGDFEFWSFMGNASDALEELAEEGTFKKLKDDVEECVDAGACREFLKFNCEDKGGNCTLEGNFTVNATFPMVSLVSTASPSPDWFVGVSSLNLCNDGEWSIGANIRLNASDAGTDAGETFTAKNKNVPFKERGNITRLNQIDPTNPFYNPTPRPEEEESENPIIGRLEPVALFTIKQDLETAELDVSGTGAALPIVTEPEDLTEAEKKQLAKEEKKIRIVGPLSNSSKMASPLGVFSLGILFVLYLL